MTIGTKVQQDAIHGRTRYCPNCVDWYPDTDVFWGYRLARAGEPVVIRGEVRSIRQADHRTAHCKSCDPRYAELLIGRKVIDRRMAGQTPVNRCGASTYCPVVLPPGRDLCHFHRGSPCPSTV